MSGELPQQEGVGRQERTIGERAAGSSARFACLGWWREPGAGRAGAYSQVNHGPTLTARLHLLLISPTLLILPLISLPLTFFSHPWPTRPHTLISINCHLSLRWYQWPAEVGLPSLVPRSSGVPLLPNLTPTRTTNTWTGPRLCTTESTPKSTTRPLPTTRPQVLVSANGAGPTRVSPSCPTRQPKSSLTNRQTQVRLWWSRPPDSVN